MITCSLSSIVLGASSDGESDSVVSHPSHESAFVFELLRRVATLSGDQLNRKNLELASGVSFEPRDGGHTGYITASSRSLIGLVFAESKSSELNFLAELVPSLPISPPANKSVIDEYMANLRELDRQITTGPCIDREIVFEYLKNSGWHFFQTENSSSPSERDGNFPLSFGDGRYLILTLDSDCLMAFSLSRRSGPPPELGTPIAPTK